MSGKSLCEDSKIVTSPLLVVGDLPPQDGNPVQYEGKVLVKGDSFGTGSIVLARLHTAVLCLFEVPVAHQASPSGKYIGKMALDFVRLKYSIEDNSNYKYCLKFYASGFSFSINCKESGEKDAWMKALSKYCILSEFDHRYSIIELIGKGSMGEVFLVL